MASLAEKNAVFDAVRSMAERLIEEEAPWMFKAQLREHLFSQKGTLVLLDGVSRGLAAAEKVRAKEAAEKAAAEKAADKEAPK